MKLLFFVIFLFFLLPLQSKIQEKMCLPLNDTFEEEKRQMIFFDLDGTLCVPHPHYLEIFASSLSEILEAESLPAETLYNAWNHALREEGTMTCSSVLESALKSLQVTNSFDCVSLACLLNEAYIPGVHLQEGAVELLKQLKDSGCIIGIITNGPFDTQMGVIKNLGLDELVHYIFISGDEKIGKRKPDPFIFHYAIESVDTCVQDIWMIGDSKEKDILPAIDAGMKGILVSNDSFVDKRFLTFKNLKELSFFLPHH